MSKKVIDFKEGDRLNTKLLVSNVVKGTTNTGAPYLSMTLQDQSKSIEGKLWDVKAELANEIKVGDVYEFELQIIEYQRALQAKILKVLPVNQNEVNKEEYAFKSPISKDVLRNNIQEGINRIENENIAKLVALILNKYSEDYYEYPAAAKIHHNFIGGLATHVSGMLKVAYALCDIYPSLNKDYLIAGVILHDLGKIEEFTSAVVTEYSIKGKLLGHISIMDALLYQASKELKLEDTEEVLLLRHMILSHHGHNEYGSPVRPETLEAEVLYFIDNIDAKVNIIEKALEAINEGEFTSKIFAMDNRSFYKHK